MSRPAFDERDAEILAKRSAAYDEIAGPRDGDFVVFADEVTRRISYVWRDERGAAFSVQTSDGGSYYLGDGYVSMSGSLYSGVKPETLTLTDEKRVGRIWFFHHDFHTAHNGVDATMPFRVFTCSEPATR
jgi:hypothetical protein